MAFQNITPTKLGQAAITVGVTTLYTTGAPINVRVFLVPAAGVAGTGNAFLYDVPVPANNALQYNGVQVMNAGETIQVQAAGAGLTITASGAEAI